MNPQTGLHLHKYFTLPCLKNVFIERNTYIFDLPIANRKLLTKSSITPKEEKAREISAVVLEMGRLTVGRIFK